MMTPVYIIAEAGVNHNGDRDRAFALVDAAADAGADAVKFQTFDAAKIAAPGAPKADYQTLTTDAAEDQLSMLRALELPYDWHHELKAHANARGIAFVSTPFDTDSLKFLAALGMPYLKVPSGELTNAPLLWQFARAGMPLILSTGMATLSEVEMALAVICHALMAESEPSGLADVWKAWSMPTARAALSDRVTLLHCTSQYPTPMEEVNLKAMDTLRVFGLPLGYSDHTQGLLATVAAVARGACMIEKHFTLDRALPGPDHAASLEPDELSLLVQQVRALELALGDGVKAPQQSEWGTRVAARQNIIAALPIVQGEPMHRAALATARTGRGILAASLWDMVGRKASRAYSPGDVIDE